MEYETRSKSGGVRDEEEEETDGKMSMDV